MQRLVLCLLCAFVIAAGCRQKSPAKGRDALPGPPAALAKRLALKVVAAGLKMPVFLAQPPGDRTSLYLVEKTGTVRILRGGRLLAAPFLDVSARLSNGMEQGLLGLAFHPRYADNGRLFINFTDRKGDTQIVELRARAGDRERVDPASEVRLLSIAQPYENHNGGHLAFGPDGLLYIGTGDGGAANDPHGNGQDRGSLLGKMLRLDVEQPKNKPEIIHIGLRNPWRYSFDARTNDLYIADVGQNLWEEVHVVPWKSRVGRNLGWNIMEGTHCFRKRDCDKSGLDLPVVEYDHKAGCSVTGGYVYRGKALPELDGFYFYADYCTGLLRGLRYLDGKVAEHYDFKGVLDPEGRLSAVSSFGVDQDGEIYILSLAGTVHKLVSR